MSIHYNAFISYRHHPDDIRVASEIHRSLERFRVPKSIRRKTGKIERLFRDKEELPITSNLSDDIGEALKNSDFLIVICSVHTKESVWVQREIELFLKSHDRNRVLTVLASGEPYDVIPDILLYEDAQDPVTGETVRREFEPLSCDWRMKRRKAVQEELPRLAAALLGCGYDELRQRQKQYRARRNMAIVSTALVASLSLAAYFLYTSITIHRANIQIQENLNQSLINQSMHLTTAAQERLDAGDRLTAISLAVAALPGQENVRPYVPEAENMLLSALGVYNTTSRLAAVGTLSPGMNVDVQNFAVTPSEKVLYMLDQRHVITAWDTETLGKLGQIPVDAAVKKLLPLPNDNLLVLPAMSSGPLGCYLPDGSCLWQLEQAKDIAYLPDTGALLTICDSPNGCGLLRLNLTDGSVIQLLCRLDELAPGLTPSGFLNDTIPAGGAAVIRFTSWDQTVVYAVDLVSGAAGILETEIAYPVASLITNDGKLLLMGSGDSMGLAGVYEGNRITEVETGKICCYDLASGTLLWENQMTACIASGNASLRQIPGSDRILCQRGNAFLVLSGADGGKVSGCEAGSGILTVSAGEQYAAAVLQDGYLCNYWYENNYCSETKCMENGVEQAFIGDSVYSLHWNGDQVTVHRDVMGAPAWEVPFEGAFSLKNQKVWGKYLAFHNNNNLCLFDTDSKKLVWQKERGSKELLGFSTDGMKLWYADGKERIGWLDLATGEAVEQPIVLEEAGGEASIRGKLYYDRDRLFYTIGGVAQPRLVIWDLSTDQKESCPLIWDAPEDVTYWSWEVLASEGSYVWLWGQEKLLLEVDMTTGSVRRILEETAHRPVIALEDSGRVAIGHQGTITVGMPGQEPAYTTALDGANAGSLYFRNGELLALCDNGFLLRWDGQGTELSRTKLQVSSSFGSNLLSPYADRTRISWQVTENNELILNALGSGNVIHCDTWSVKAAISDLLICGGDGTLVCKLGGSIAGYPMYETAQLLELAAKELNGFRLSPEQQSAYGID